jgi:alkanesulfonate monooxygenase SsuD/methylene tetrahydromethanopterin reductase-like flavin-dependent oxidoreductase (luciferase family)
VHDTVDEQRRRAPDLSRGHRALDVARHTWQYGVARQVAVEPGDIELELERVSPQVLVLERRLAMQEQLRHLPESALQRRGLRGGGGGEGVRMDLGQREVTEREANPVAQLSLDALDLAKRLARIRAFVVAVLDDQTSGRAATNMVDGWVYRLQGGLDDSDGMSAGGCRAAARVSRFGDDHPASRSAEGGEPVTRTLDVGISIVPYADALDRNRELVRVADEGGLAFVGVQDHPYQHHFFDTWSLIPTLLAETKQISFFTDVANLPLRPPAVMAKAAASLDVLSGGRFELGLGAGAIPDVIANFGGPRRTPGESVEALDEAIDVIRLMWSEQRSVSFHGRYYHLDDARPGPRPAHPIAIWVGAFKPRMLRLVGRKADGWLPSLGVLTREELRVGHDQIDAAAVKAGRDPRSIRRIINLQGLIGDRAPPRRSELRVGYLAGEPLAGPPEWWAETLAGFVDDGFDTLVFWPVDPSPSQVELLIGEVLPLLPKEIPDRGEAMRRG